MRGRVNQFGQELFLVEGHPADTDPLGDGREPQVLDRQHRGEEPRVGDGVTAEDMRTTAPMVVGDHHPGATLTNTFNLDGVEGVSPPFGKAVGESLALQSDMRGEVIQHAWFAYHHEIPWLTISDTGRTVRGLQQLHQRRVVDNLTGELGAHVPAGGNGLVDVHHSASGSASIRSLTLRVNSVALRAH